MTGLQLLDHAVSEKEIIELLQDLIRIPSHWETPGRERNVALHIHAFLLRHGIEAELMPVLEDRPNVVAVLRGSGGGKRLMLNGHTDTVRPYGMKAPYDPVIREGRIYGRGACDMKAGVATMMMALLALQRAKIPLKGDVIFTGVINEELKSEGTEAIVTRGPKADFAIVGEPTELSIAPGHRGLEWLDIVIEGKTAHGGVPERGVNAISKAAKLLRAIEEDLIPRLAAREHPGVGKSILNFGTIHGGDQPSSVAGRCVLQLDRRYTPEESLEQVFRDFEEIFEKLRKEDPDFKATLHRNPDNMATMDHLPVYVEPEHPLVRALMKAHREVRGEEARCLPKTGWTDASLLANYGNIPAVNLGPGSVAQAHREDEYVAISHLKPAALIYAMAAVHLCS
jgi:acetylornithine deacetylase/succinyl-diaminopimelate desuccinylase